MVKHPVSVYVLLCGGSAHNGSKGASCTIVAFRARGSLKNRERVRERERARGAGVRKTWCTQVSERDAACDAT